MIVSATGAMEQAVKAGKCLSAKGRFPIRGCGEECEAKLTALEVVDGKGAVAGLIYDAGMM